MIEHTAAPKAHTLLTALSLDQVQVLAIPFTTALAELRTYGALLHARTLGDARSDPMAAHVVELQLPTYLEQQWQDADLGVDVDEADWVKERSQDDAAFDANDFWGEDDFMEWHPEPRHATAAWLATEPTLAQRYARPDEGWGFDYSPVSLIAPADRDAFEVDAEAVGYQVKRADGLERLYLAGPSSDAFVSLAAVIDASSGPDAH